MNVQKLQNFKALLAFVAYNMISRTGVNYGKGTSLCFGFIVHVSLVVVCTAFIFIYVTILLKENTKNYKFFTKALYSTVSPGTLEGVNVSSLFSFFTPEVDDLKFKSFIIPKNKLQVIVISNPGAKESGAAMSVGAGSNDDPDSHLGLAHLCEHMLSMGSRKYPDFNTYLSFVHTYGGMKNAFTTDEETQYHFRISSAFLFEALDIFSNLFISPLFNEHLLEKEINIVHHEYLQNLNHKGFKLKEIMSLVSPRGHPMHRFKVGDKTTLRKVDIRFQLLTFFYTKYSAENVSITTLYETTLRIILEICQGIYFWCIVVLV